jgi:DNA repair exonuclease SbcCD nuclease subunit
MFRFIHAADIHLDSPLLGLRAYDSAPIERLRTAPRRALENLVDLAIRTKVDFLLIAGDVFDGDWKDYSTGQFFVKQMAKLRDCRIPVYLIAGNHDAENKMSRSLPYPDNVHVFESSHATTRRIESIQVAIHGQSFATQAVTEDLSMNYPAQVPGWFNIGLLHTSCTGREGHENYAPCTLEGLGTRNYDYWALGHIHKREVLSQKPWVVFPGNIQGRHAKETGPKGCYVVSVSEQQSIEATFEPLDVLRWETLALDVGPIGDLGELPNLFKASLQETIDRGQDRLLAVRVELQGQSPLHRKFRVEREHILQSCQSVATGLSIDGVWIEKVLCNTRIPNESDQQPDASQDAIRAVMEVFQDAKTNPDFYKQLQFDMSSVRSKIPSELRTAELDGYLGGSEILLEQAQERLLDLLGSEFSHSDSARAESMKSDLGETL